MGEMMASWLDAVNYDKDGLIPAIAQDHRTGRILMMAWMNRESLTLTAEKMQAVYWSRSRGKLWHKGESSGHFQQVHEIRLDCDADVIVLSVTQMGGIACHTGRESCFYRLLTDEQGQATWTVTDAVLKDPEAIYGADTHKHEHSATEPTTATTLNSSQSSTHTATSSADILTALDQVLVERKNASPDSSYVASLYHKGLNKILEKVGEEATETIIAAKDVPSDTAQMTEPTYTEAVDDLIYEIADVWFHTMVTLAWFNIPSTRVTTELARRFGLSGIEEKASRQPS